MRGGLAPLAGRHLLFLNWRDRRHPRAGGAELYAESIAEEMVAHGVQVTLFAARPDGAPLAEVTPEGLRVVRRGGTFGVYLAALRHLRRHRDRYDAVVDFQNGIPFFAPVVVGPRMPVVLVVHHVHQDQFRHYFPRPVSSIGRWLEGPASRVVYRGRPTVAVSPSTRQELRQRLRLDGPIFVVPNGVDPLRRRGDRAARPRIAVVTRLVPHKRLHLLIDAAAELRRSWPSLRVDIGGDGPDRGRLESHARDLGVADIVRFHGYVSDQDRERLLTEAWLTVLPSQAEGWGLTVLEAASVGTPAVAYRVPGLRDSILDGETGWLCPPGGDLATAVSEALERLSDRETAARTAERCRRWADNFTWEDAADRLGRVVNGEMVRREGGPSARRRDVDLAVRVTFEVEEDADAVERRLRERMRTTDRLARDGRRFQLLMYGSDEVGAARAVRRAGATGRLELSLAGPDDLLLDRGTVEP